MERPKDEFNPLTARSPGKNLPDYPAEVMWQPIVDVRETEDEMFVNP